MSGETVLHAKVSIFKRLGPGKDQPSQQRRLGRRKEQRAMDAADEREEELQDRLLKGFGP